MTYAPALVHERVEAAPARGRLPWICVEQGLPYFIDETGAAFTPIGQNDAISWVEFKGLYARRDLPAVERHLIWLRDNGVTVLRLMLEYAQVRSRYFERPFGQFVPNMVQLWDDLFALCERVGMRILLTPVDTFWTWIHWRHHPYNQANGGPLDHPSRLLLCGETREGIKRRLRFAAERWGGSGALFAWDLWNEIHPAQAQESADCFPEFIADLSETVRRTEMRAFGRTHPQTVSLFGPELRLRGHMPLHEPIFRHPDLDFASLHVYGSGPVDNPKDTVGAAVVMGRVVRDSLAEIRDGRPFLDTEHGPIHAFKDRKKTLESSFDDEYFRHMQWAHLASGGAGGGMRWPNRHPHALTPGMRAHQAALSRFLPLIDWTRFRRVNLNEEVRTSRPVVARFACGDERQAVIWLLRRTTVGPGGRLRTDVPPLRLTVEAPGFAPGRYAIIAFDTVAGAPAGSTMASVGPDGRLAFDTPPFTQDLAFAVHSEPDA